MKTVMRIAALAATLMAGSALPAFADTITGQGTAASPAILSNFGDFGSLSFPVSGLVSTNQPKFSYAYYFQVDSASKLAGITASASSVDRNGVPNVNFTSFQVIDLFAQVPVSGSIASYYPGLTGQSYSLTANKTYELIVRGDVLSGTGKFNGNLTVVSSVPLPTSVALFGTAILGLGAFGALRRKKEAAAATA